MSDQEELQDQPDGFRPRKTRPPGWLERAIADGSVRDPKLGPEPPQTYRADQHVIGVPVATIAGDGE